ncbi:MAG: hypothetical protein ABI656_04680 [bacterium]
MPYWNEKRVTDRSIEVSVKRNHKKDLILFEIQVKGLVRALGGADRLPLTV